MKKPVLCDYEGLAPPQFSIFTWRCPTCEGVNVAFIDLDETQIDVDCSGCGARWRLTVEWVENQSLESTVRDEG